MAREDFFMTIYNSTVDYRNSYSKIIDLLSIIIQEKKKEKITHDFYLEQNIKFNPDHPMNQKELSQILEFLNLGKKKVSKYIKEMEDFQKNNQNNDEKPTNKEIVLFLKN